MWWIANRSAIAVRSAARPVKIPGSVVQKLGLSSLIVNSLSLRLHEGNIGIFSREASDGAIRPSHRLLHPHRDALKQYSGGKGDVGAIPLATECG